MIDELFGFPCYFTTVWFIVPVILGLAGTIWGIVEDKKREKNWRKYHEGKYL